MSRMPLIFALLFTLLTIISATPDEHAHPHSSHTQPQKLINETEILQHHDPDPLSYYAHDSIDGYKGLMILHVLGMSVAFWVLLPMGTYAYSSLGSDHAARRHFLTVLPRQSSHYV